MTEAKDCKYGLWTNGLEFFFFEKQLTRFDVKFQPLGDWPLGDESIGSRTVASQRPAASRRPRDAAHGLPPLPQLHPRQRGHAEGRRLLAVPLPHLREDARRAPRPDEPPRFWAGLFERSQRPAATR